MNAKVIIAMVVLVVGVQSAAVPDVLPSFDAGNVAMSRFNIVHWIERVAQDLQQAITSKFLSWTEHLQTIEDRFFADLEEMVDAEIYAQIRNQNATNCVREHIARIVAINQEAGQDAAQCIKTGINQVNDLNEALQQHVDAIRAEGRKIGQVVQSCRDNRPDDLRQCVLDNLKEIVDSVKAIVAETVELLVQAVAQSQVIVDLTKACVQEVKQRVAQQQIDSQTELRSCLAAAIAP